MDEPASRMMDQISDLGALLQLQHRVCIRVLIYRTSGAVPVKKEEENERGVHESSPPSASKVGHVAAAERPIKNNVECVQVI